MTFGIPATFRNRKASKTSVRRFSVIFAVCLFVSLITSIFIVSGIGSPSKSANANVVNNYVALTTSASQSTLSRFVNEIANLQHVKSNEISLANTPSKSHVDWSVNSGSIGGSQWVSVAIWGDGGNCSYYLENNTNSAIFGAGIGKWISTQGPNLTSCDANVAPPFGVLWSGWQKIS
ncbi:MAG: hypothetical protein HKL80_08975 [Acidimicrobiales bacterium]|nr:hypothetical protein [Acidimicrobiales bacterium]